MCKYFLNSIVFFFNLFETVLIVYVDELDMKFLYSKKKTSHYRIDT